ncbi:MAG TPA: uracil-DNA glycosylase [Solirubrobacteraceae bacterium]
MPSAEERREALRSSYVEARACARCPQLAGTRTQVVFGTGNADADLMFVGEAPGAEEDKQGLPFVGRSGQLLTELLTEIGLQREDVFITNTLLCRPPGNRDPAPSELSNCESYLWEKLELIQPIVVCTLGNFATKLLRGEATGITHLHGRAEVRTLGPRTVRLLPLFHPAAALYQRSNVEVLRQDFAQIPALLAEGPPPQPVVAAVEAEPEPEPPAPEAEPQPDPPAPAEPKQLGLF